MPIKNTYLNKMRLVYKSVLFTLLVPGSVAVIVPILISNNPWTELLWLRLTGGFFLLLGFTVYCWCAWDFATFGQGTPAPIDAPKYLVVRGLYRYTRNPMYVGVLSVILGWSLLYSDLYVLIYVCIVASSFQLFIVFYEEPILQKTFGTEYAEYRSLVNRWLPTFCLRGNYK